MILKPGSYVVCEVAQATCNQTKSAMTSCTACSPTLSAGGYADTLTFAHHDTANTYNYTHSLHDALPIFNDLNANGVNDGEPGLSGWTINAYADTNTNGV